MERFFALILVIFLFPFLLFISILIMIDSRGSPIFIQRRVGKNKKLFDLYKFRTMYVNSDERLNDYLRKNEKAKEEWENFRKLKSYDPRITRIGKWLRRYSLDEIPQLFNILKGEMSFVGPRPYIPEEINGLPGEFDEIFSVKPGLTGPWQVGGRNKLTLEERIKIEKKYVKEKTLKKDLLIILKTFPVIFKNDYSF